MRSASQHILCYSKRMLESYVYEIVVADVVRYIGMGKGQRTNVHISIAKNIIRRRESGRSTSGLRVHFELADAIQAGAEIAFHFVAVGLQNEAARMLEKQLIAAAPRDQIWNVHAGGGGASSERMVELWSDPDWRAKQAILVRSSTWDDPTYRQQMNALRSSPEFRNRVRRSVVERFADPAERQAQAKRTRAAMAGRPDLRAAQSDRTKQHWNDRRDTYTQNVKAHWSDPAQRQRQSEAAKKQWSKPESREKLLNAARSKWTPELREWRRQKTKEQWAAKKAAALIRSDAT